MSKEAEFLARIKTYQGLEKSKSSESARFGALRLLAFGLLIFGVYLFSTSSNLLLPWSIVLAGLVLFALLIVLHNKVKSRINILKNIQQINKGEIDRLNLNLHEFEAGTEYKDKLHPFVNDLDVFGQHSLFQTINRCATKEGEQVLADMFKSKVSYAEAIKRQAIVKELSGAIDWRQEFQSGNGTVYNEVGEIGALVEWVNEPQFYQSRPFLKWITLFFPIVPVGVLIAMNYGLAPILGLSIIMILPVLFARSKKVITEIKERTSRRLKDLKRYVYLIEMIENKQLESQELKDLQSTLLVHGKASHKIGKLKSILTWMEGTDNVFFYILSHFTILWEFQIVRFLDQWKASNKEHILSWVDTVEQFDAYNSIAGFAYANVNFVYPELTNEEYDFAAENLGHPLISGEERISNDFEFTGISKLMLITGSNMSGKSTFLRTIGVNIFLANIGAPVCATKCRLSPMYLFTSMRTEDSIEESTSSFYAELKRIEQLISVAKTGDKVLFMLDEILKGTNSQDRHNGAEALIRQMRKFELTGFISTHDLELTDLEQEKELSLTNYSFTSEFENDRLIFDYKIKNGPCTSFNASQLMRSIGIELQV